MTTPLLDQFGAEITRIPGNPQGKLVIGIVHGEEVDGWHFHSMINLLTSLKDQPDSPISEVVCVRSGPALQLGRGVLINTFLERTDGDALLMLDSDMMFTPQTIADHWVLYQGLPTHNGPKAQILGGLAFISSQPHIRKWGSLQPNIWAPDPKGRDLLCAFYDYPMDQLLGVGATGAACLMMSREVLQAISEHSYGHLFHHVKLLNYPLLARHLAGLTDPVEIEALMRKEINGADELGEDLSFCQRAKELGYGIYLHTALKYGHSKNFVIEEEDYLLLKQKEVTPHERPDHPEPAEPATGQLLVRDGAGATA